MTAIGSIGLYFTPSLANLQNIYENEMFQNGALISHALFIKINDAQFAFFSGFF
jgi:hypothetical protein